MLLTVKNACTLQPNALNIQVSEQVERIDEIIVNAGNGEAFFGRTHITGGMDTLIRVGLARLAGQSNDAIFHLKQAMGGGKTHLMIGLGYLAKHPDLRAKVCPHVPYAQDFGSAKVAAFNGRNNPEEYFWGDIATQLGRGELFRRFWSEGPRAPEEKDWLALFDDTDPILIVLDELPPYFTYFVTQRLGQGTIADVITRAFANMLSAAGKKKNVAVVVSDLFASYDTGSRLINNSLADARNELGRQERIITPVDLAGNEVYAILRKNLFQSLPDQATIDDIATRYATALEEAAKAKTAARGAEAIADEIAQTYPFHPRLKSLIALFKENESFKQTRGLIELVSRLLRSVWERPTNDVYLIGAQHFDLSIADVRDKLAEISGMRDVIAKDLWDAQGAGHAQIIDYKGNSDACMQVGTLLLTSSLSTAVNAVRGLNARDLVECLITPTRSASEFRTAFEALEADAWYLHHTVEGRYYFDRQENLTKMLQSYANDAPEPQIEALIQSRLKQMFAATRKSGYAEVSPLPKLDDVPNLLRRQRVLLILDPSTRLPADNVTELFASITQKNNILILTGDKTEMASVQRAARQHYAAQKADTRIPVAHPQREDLERKQIIYDQDFTAVVLNLFDKVVFPIHRPGAEPALVVKPLDMSRDTQKPFVGEEQITKTLVSKPQKLYQDIEADFDILREKAESFLWPESQDEARWIDMEDRAAEQSGMPWLAPGDLERLRTIACARGFWEELGNGSVTKRPKKKKTSVQVTVENEPDDHGKVRLRVNPQNAGPAPEIYYSTDGSVSASSPRLADWQLATDALRVTFLVHDPSGTYETGDPVVWKNKLVIRNELVETNGQRTLSLFVAPRGRLRYTLDGSAPRDGVEYTGPIPIDDGTVLVRVFAEAEGLEASDEFRFQAKGRKGIDLDNTKPAKVVDQRSGKMFDSRTKTYAALAAARAAGTTFEQVTVTVGEGSKMIRISVGELTVTADYVESLLTAALSQFDDGAPVTMRFQTAYFASGHDLRAFAESHRIELRQGEVIQ